MWVLMATVFVDMIGFLMILPLLPFYAERLGADAFTVGILVSSFAMAQLASAPLWGRFSDRYGRKPMLILGLVASSLAYITFAYADSLWLLLLSRMVQGAGGGTAGVAMAYIADVVAPEDRTRALGWLSAATSLGVTIGPVLGSLSVTLGPRAPGLVASALCLANVVFSLIYLPESRSSAPKADRQPLAQSMVQVVRHPLNTAHTLIWIYAFGMMAFMAMNGILALFLERKFAFNEGSIGYVYLFVGALSVVMRALLLGPLVKRFGESGVMKVGAFSITLGLVSMPLAPTVFSLFLVMAFIPVGTALLFPATSSQVSRHAEPGETGQLLGVQQSFGGVARMVGPIWAGAAFQYLSWSMPFYLAGTLTAFVFVLTLILFRGTGEIDSPAETDSLSQPIPRPESS